MVEWSTESSDARVTCTSELGWGAVVEKVATHRNPTTVPNVAHLFAGVASGALCRLNLQTPTLPTYMAQVHEQVAASKLHLAVSLSLAHTEQLKGVLAASTAVQPVVDIISLHADLLAEYVPKNGEVGAKSMPFFTEFERLAGDIVSKGTIFEIVVGTSLRDPAQREGVIFLFKKVVRALKGREGLILSSGTGEVLLLRRPEDYANILTLGGIPYGTAVSVLHASNAKLFHSVTSRNNVPGVKLVAKPVKEHKKPAAKPAKKQLTLAKPEGREGGGGGGGGAEKKRSGFDSSSDSDDSEEEMQSSPKKRRIG